MSKTCETCVFFTRKENSKLLSNVPFNVCREHTKVLPAAIFDLEKEASSCSAYKEGSTDPTELAPSPVFGPFMADERFVEGITITTDKGGYTGTCYDCYFYAASNVAYEKFGVPSAVCTRNVSIIMPGAENIAPQRYGCRSDMSSNALKVDQIEPFPYIEDYNVMVVDPHKDAKDSNGKPVPKSEIPTRDATDDERADGITKWFILKSNGKSVELPVFDETQFSDEERAKIPCDGDEEHPELYVDHLNLTYKVAAVWLGLGQTPALNGVAGSGKTEFFRHMAYLMRLPFERVNISEQTELDDLTGKMHFREGYGTFFEYGRIPESWKKRCVILIDEPNTGKNAVWQFFRPLTDNSKQLVLDVNRGERIEKNKYCYMGMAMNPSWDSRNIGARDISDADGRRLYHVAVPPPSAKVESGIIKAHCELINYDISQTTVNTILAVAADLRKLADDDAIPIQWGLSQNVKVAQATKYFTIHEAYRLAATDLLEEAVAAQIAAVVTGYSVE